VEIPESKIFLYTGLRWYRSR